VARDRETGAAVTDGMWSDVGNITASVIHPDTGLTVSRDWYGSGTLVQISDLPAVSNLSVQQVTIRLSQIVDNVEILVRQYDCKQARVEVYRGLFDPDTRLMVAPAECRFFGFVDEIEINTPTENDEGSVELQCASHTQEMTRANTDTRNGATIPAGEVPCKWITGPVERIDGQIHLTLILPHGPNPSMAVAFPAPIIDPPDGDIALPFDLPVEEPDDVDA